MHKEQFNLNISSLNTISFKVTTIQSDFTDLVYLNPLKFINFINIINKKHIIFIGPSYIKNLSFINIKKTIIIPLKNCFTKVEEIQKKIIDEINSDNISKCFLFSAGLTTNYIIEKIKNKALNKHFMIDIGSAFDNFLSKETFPQITRRIYNPTFIKENYPSNYWIK